MFNISSIIFVVGMLLLIICEFCVTFEKSKLKSPFPSKELGVGT